MNDSVLSIEMEVEVVVTMVMVVVVEVFKLYIIVSNKKDIKKTYPWPKRHVDNTGRVIGRVTRYPR